MAQARKSISPLEGHLGYWLRFVSNQVSQAFAEKVSGHGVTVAEWVVLRELFDGAGLMQSALAERMGMTRGAISKLADRLEAKGLIVRRGDAGDARLQILELTASGRKLTPVLAALADQNDEEFFGALSKGERAAIEGAMRAIVKRKGLRGAPTD